MIEFMFELSEDAHAVKIRSWVPRCLILASKTCQIAAIARIEVGNCFSINVLLHCDSAPSEAREFACTAVEAVIPPFSPAEFDFMSAKKHPRSVTRHSRCLIAADASYLRHEYTTALMHSVRLSPIHQATAGAPQESLHNFLFGTSGLWRSACVSRARYVYVDVDITRDCASKSELAAYAVIDVPHAR